MKCSMCLAGLHKSCRNPSCACNQASHEDKISIPTGEVISDERQDKQSLRSVGSDPQGEDVNERLAQRVGRSNKGTTRRDATLKDQQSTGRKRAARWYPLDREGPCEWKGLTNCGGNTGILGCHDGKQQARHHGPDKSVSNNEAGNVHRICHACHNRWHTINDPIYDWNSTVKSPHDPRPQTVKEQALAQIEHFALQGKKLSKIKD